jgi:hypothetical protein
MVNEQSDKMHRAWGRETSHYLIANILFEYQLGNQSDNSTYESRGDLGPNNPGLPPRRIIGSIDGGDGAMLGSA